MAIKEQIIYDHEMFVKITSEEVLTADGKPTGFHKELKREVVTVLGILDNEENYIKETGLMDRLQTDVGGSFFYLHGDGFFQVFQVTSIDPLYESLSDACITVLRGIGWIKTIQHHYDGKKLQSIEYEVFDRTKEKFVYLTLESYTDKLMTIGRV